MSSERTIWWFGMVSPCYQGHSTYKVEPALVEQALYSFWRSAPSPLLSMLLGEQRSLKTRPWQGSRMTTTDLLVRARTMQMAY